MDEPVLTHRYALYHSMASVLSGLPLNARDGVKDDDCYCNVPKAGNMADAVALCKRLMRQGAHGHHFG